MPGTVLAVSCHALVTYGEARGAPAQSWLDKAGLTRDRLADPEARLEPTLVFALWREAYATLGDPALALHVAESLPRGAYRVIEYLAANAPTLGEAYSKVADYFSVVDSTTRLVVDDKQDAIAFGPAVATPDAAVFPGVEFMMAACYLRVRDMTASAHQPVSVDFAAPCQPHSHELERVFSSPVRWEAQADRLWFSRDTWSQPTANADPHLLNVLEEHARVLRERNPAASSLVEVIDRHLERAWERGEPTLEQIARELGMSSRTLQRRLGEAGAAFSERLDEARKKATLRWLACPDVSLAEVAYLVGFREQASLTRAVRRWTGKTPKELRMAPSTTKSSS